MKKQKAKKKKTKETLQLSDWERSRQINREVLAGILLYAAYFVWWSLAGYGLSARETVHYTLGMPDWFFYSCVVGYIWFSIAAILLVKLYYKDFDLGEEAEDYDMPAATDSGEEGNK